MAFVGSGMRTRFGLSHAHQTSGNNLVCHLKNLRSTISGYGSVPPESQSFSLGMS